jgi:site-specific DNA-methyltransferase (adenine-specific)
MPKTNKGDKKMSEKIKVLEEIKNLIQPLENDEFARLEELILKEGCRDALVIAKTPDDEFLADGHNRLNICTKHSLPYKIVIKNFDSFADVKIWIIKTQLGRRNLSAFCRSELAESMRKIVAEKAKRNESLGGGNRKSGCQNSDNPIPKIDTNEEIASIACVSKDTQARVHKIIETLPESEILKDLRKGVLSVNEVYSSLKNLPAEISPEEKVDRIKEDLREKDIKKKNKFTEAKVKALSTPIQKQVNETVHKEIGAKTGNVFLINKKHKLIVGDCFDHESIKKHIGSIDAVLTDPPYGIAYKSPSGSCLTKRGDYDVIQGDEKPFEPEILFKYSEKIITWGANHYANLLPNSAGWLVWDKREGDAINNNSDCELAWTNMLGSARIFHHKWNGMIKASEKYQKRIHPTQKPIALMKWCLEITSAGKTILDLFSGSGSTLIACEESERICYLVEKDEKTASTSLKRFQELGYTVEEAE